MPTAIIPALISAGVSLIGQNSANHATQAAASNAQDNAQKYEQQTLQNALAALNAYYAKQSPVQQYQLGAPPQSQGYGLASALGMVNGGPNGTMRVTPPPMVGTGGAPGVAASAPVAQAPIAAPAPPSRFMPPIRRYMPPPPGGLRTALNGAFE